MRACSTASAQQHSPLSWFACHTHRLPSLRPAPPRPAGADTSAATVVNGATVARGTANAQADGGALPDFSNVFVRSATGSGR